MVENPCSRMYLQKSRVRIYSCHLPGDEWICWSPYLVNFCVVHSRGISLLLGIPYFQNQLLLQFYKWKLNFLFGTIFFFSAQLSVCSYFRWGSRTCLYFNASQILASQRTVFCRSQMALVSRRPHYSFPPGTPVRVWLTGAQSPTFQDNVSSAVYMSLFVQERLLLQ